MDFIYAAISDIGISRKVNQDALFVSTTVSPFGNIGFAVVCDGMGGLTQGEVASASLISAFKEWYHKELPILSQSKIQDKDIVEQWNLVIKDVNSRIKKHGEQNNSRLGSTVTVLLLTEYRYFLMNIGDTRAYLLKNGVNQLTVDHTLVEQQIRLGNLTREQAEKSSIRSVITRCVGVTEEVYPDFFFGTPENEAMYILCSDGFRHKIKESEIYSELSSRKFKTSIDIQQSLFRLVELNKYRKETDNISVVGIFTYEAKHDIPEFDFFSDDYDDDATIQLFDDQAESDLETEITLIHSNTIL